MNKYAVAIICVLISAILAYLTYLIFGAAIVPGLSVAWIIIYAIIGINTAGLSLSSLAGGIWYFASPSDV